MRIDSRSRETPRSSRREVRAEHLPDREPAGERRRCRHCATEFAPRFENEHFCCSGCRVVAELIESGGFQSFYDLLGNRTLQPVENGEPSADFLAELTEEVQRAEEIAGDREAAARLRLRVGNLSCTACVWLIDHLFRRYPGGLKVQSDTSRSVLTIYWTPGEFDVVGFVGDLHRYGYPSGLVGDLDEEFQSESRALLTRLGVTGGLAMNAMAFSLPSYLGLETDDELARLFTLVAFASATLALAVGGSYFFQRAWGALRMRVLHMDVPISLGLIAAYLGSLGGLAFGVEEMLYFDFVATFAFLMLGGRWLHLRLLEKNRRQLWAREQDFSATFRLGQGDARERIPLGRVEAGDRLEISPGAMVPVEAELEDDSAGLHVDWINGEPDLVPFRGGQILPAGGRNGSGRPIRVVARERFRGSFLESLLSVSEEAEENAASSSGNPILRWYLVTVLAVAFLGGAAWVTLGGGVSRSLQVFISILVVSCPCALGLALPLLDEMLLSRLKHRGIFIRQHSIWRRIRDVRILAFDKTGTLTEPVQRLANPEDIESLDPEAFAVLRHLTVSNSHPVGKALREAITARHGLAEKPLAAPCREISGAGMETEWRGRRWRLGRAEWALAGPGSGETIPEAGGGRGDCVFTRDGEPVVDFRIREAIREGAAEQLSGLRGRGFRIRVLSGDPDRDRVLATATGLGLDPDEVRAGLKPEDKARDIRENDPEATLFMGDGGNDSLAFGAAAVTGAPATGIRAIEGQADFVFTGRGFHAISQLLDRARRRDRLVRVIFSVAIVYNISAVAICLAGLMNPLLAAVLMPLSSIVTTAIAARV